MRNRYAAVLATSALLLAGLAGCRKENGIDNNNVILKPYAVYAGDAQGGLSSSNDGELFYGVFPFDGFPARALVTAGTNIVMVKANVFTSEDNGKNFNPAYLRAMPFALWQQMILHVPSHGRIYIASSVVRPEPLGRAIAYSDNNGVTWKEDNAFDTLLGPGIITSFAQISSGLLFAYSADSNRLYRRDNKDDRWSKIEPNGLPGNDLTFYLHHFNNTLVLASYAGGNGAYYSTDSGRNWTKFGGLPPRNIYAMSSPLDRVLIAGLDSVGVYRSVTGTSAFVPSSSGLDRNTSVYGIAGKENEYKNGELRSFIYIATSTGVYRSEDEGQNWIKVKDGDHRTIY